ncbi:hypothetical protein GGR35_001290 [Mucilaginibacter phyllosphaerae]|uniref:Uncharacterized protein n=1 Tax=Mucilaginibacter phyllosphaerae TaxID=1812349 RepID=A0ABR6I6N5_9SPHI|nr:hypothetical protein [Mucilaginibacter phyllosphaerae]
MLQHSFNISKWFTKQHAKKADNLSVIRFAIIKGGI